MVQFNIVGNERLKPMFLKVRNQT